MMRWNLCLAAATMMSLSATPSAANEATEIFQEYTDFATYDAGVIRPDQLTPEIVEGIVFIDTRRAEEFKIQSIPGARNIEWREVFNRIEELPVNQKIVLFCNTGVLSAQAAFGLRVLGYENVLVLQGGLNGWHQNANQ